VGLPELKPVPGGAMAKKSKPKKKKKKKLSAAEKLTLRTQRKFYREFRTLFNQMGFARVKADSVEIVVDGRKGELDDIFVYENVLVLVEYTIGRPSSEHVLGKKPLFDRIQADVPRFLNIARTRYPDLIKHLRDIYDDTHYHIRIIYASLVEVAPEIAGLCPDVKFLQGGLKKYFLALGKTIQKSARVEFFSYLKLKWEDVGEGVLTASTQSREYAGQLLPASMSSYPKNYKVVSFYADPESLIASAYVLRRDGWMDGSHLYQRILVRGKIAKMRRYLVDQERVFVNNIIVTLPANTPLNDPKTKGANVPAKDLNKAQPVTVSIPAGYSTIGIIDGQHRVFCYHEGDDALDADIATLRKRQHLLVTAIIYPTGITENARLEFEARLFLEINDTQTRARPALRQDIETIVRPFSGIAVARRVIAELSKHGPYRGMFQLAYFDSAKKIKTSSIVSYGLRPLLKFEGSDSLFSAWKNPHKEKLKARERKSAKDNDYDQDLQLLNEYVEFCVRSLNDFFTAAKLSHDTSHWDLEDDTPSELLRPTSINGLIACLRRVIGHGMSLSLDAHKRRMTNFSSFKFGNYTSSQWGALGDALFDKHYKHSGS
jgi:DGQHR domain-containing protein